MGTDEAAAKAKKEIEKQSFGSKASLEVSVLRGKEIERAKRHIEELAKRFDSSKSWNKEDLEEFFEVRVSEDLLDELKVYFNIHTEPDGKFILTRKAKGV